MSRPLIVVTGTYRQPELQAYFSRNAPHPRVPGKSLSDLMKSFPAAFWRTDHWTIKGIGRFDADAVFERAGFEVDFESETYDTDLEGIDTLDELVPPMFHLTEDRRNVLIRHRLLGFQETKELLGTGSMWDRNKQRFYMPVGDLLKRGKPREGLDIPEDALEAAWEQHDRIHTGDHLLHQASKAALAKDVVDLSEKEINALVDEVGDIPKWFGLPLYPYQRVGAIAVAAGHNLLADGMRVGKALHVDEPVLTPHGFVRIGDIRAGDTVIGTRGRTRVQGVYPQGIRDLSRVSISDGTELIVDDEHLWTVEIDGVVVPEITTADLRTAIESSRSVRLPSYSPVDTEHTRPIALAEPDAGFIRDSGSMPPNLLGHGVEGRTRIAGLVHRRHFATTHDADTFASLLRSLGKTVSVHGRRVRVHRSRRGRQVSSVTPAGRGEAVCIEVDAADHLFLARDYIVTHNTRTTLAVAAMRDAKRTLIVCPPVVLTNWNRNSAECLLATLGGKNPDGKIIEFRPGRKEPELPDSGVVIISDSLMTSRKHLQDALVGWAPDVMIVDEAHRAKTFHSARTQAILRVAAASAYPIPATGTPLFQTPQELAPLLEMTGHLTPVFGGLDEFHETYCVQNKWGAFTPRMKSLPDLRRMLDTFVWVRRTKDQVLKDLPKVSRGAIDLDIDLKEFNAAHREVVDKINDWLDEFDDEFGRLPDHNHVNKKGRSVDEIEEHARDKGLTYISKLRRAAGITKVPAAVEYIKEHVYSTTEIDNRGRKTFTRPLLVWTHHTEVSEAMSEVIPNEVDDAAIIMGGISQNKRQRLIDEFQEGRIPVLVCQISAAGVGIDLTRSSDALFVETDWVPALVQQAEERIQGVNQKRPVMLSTMVAKGTLDDRIQRIQEDKAKVLDPILGGKNDVSVVRVSDDEANSTAILMEMVDTEIAKRKKKRR